jgi:hypothetical protein
MSPFDTSLTSQLNVDSTLYNPSNNVDLPLHKCSRGIKNASISISDARGCSFYRDAIFDVNNVTESNYNHSKIGAINDDTNLLNSTNTVLINKILGEETLSLTLHDLLGKHSAEKLYPLGVSFGTEFRHWEKCAGALVGPGIYIHIYINMYMFYVYVQFFIYTCLYLFICIHVRS